MEWFILQSLARGADVPLPRHARFEPTNHTTL